ncbi:hypothetical protein COB72_10065 [bacterium]|nr:MAG: hypothetical protein COB72_10065 [bacterium]
MSSIPNQHESNQHHDQPSWRVILVGRTGLDQLLRRDASIELIRAKDTIDAIGELSDPIDVESPAQAAVVVAASIEPSDDELVEFIESLRLIDSQVRVLRVGSQRSPYDGCIDAQANLEAIIQAIEKAEPTGEAVALRFIDAPEEEVPTEPEAESKAEPEIVVVAKNEDFEHKAQESFEDESELHKQVLIGAEAIDTPTSASQQVSSAGPNDDQAMVEAMLAGRSVLELAVERINARLDRDDVSFVPDEEAVGMPVMVGNQIAGKLVCKDQSWAMGDGHEALTQQSQWLAGWVKLEIQQAELRNAAFTDSLTGAWNRRYFTRYLDAAIIQSRIARQPLTVMLFDIDGFKHYNDAYGHAAGDEILVETVKLLKSVIRPSDRVCRVGGDEFAVIFYEPKGPRDTQSKPLESVYQIATRFQKQICSHRFPKLAGEAQGTLTVSGGLASYPWDGHDSESLLEQADQLAMESKRNGKNAMTLGPGAESICKNKQ